MNNETPWESLLAGVVGAAPGGVVVIRANSQGEGTAFEVLMANEAAERLLERADPGSGETIEAWFEACGRRDCVARCVAVAQGGQEDMLGEVSTLDGQVFGVKAAPLGNGFAALFIEDITLDKATEVALQDAIFLHEIFEHIPDMIFVKDAEELRFVRFNKAGEDLLGLSRAELMGKNDHDFFPKEEAEFFISKDREVLAAGELLDILEEPIHTVHRGLRWLHTKKIPILDEAGKPRYLLGISQDITEAKNIASELERSNADLEHFAYVASHDLKEPLRKITMFVGRLQTQNLHQLDEAGRDMFERVIKAAERMQTLIEDLLELSRVMRPEGERAVIDLGAATREALVDLQMRLRDTSIHVEIDDLPRVEGYGRQFQQLMQNLLSNAIKFRRRGVRSQIRVYESSEGQGSPLGSGYCRVVVEDNGIGFEEKFAERIFKPFQRLHGRGSYPGSGMGLAICQRIVEGHKGRIEVHSKLGSGSRFIIDLPRVPE